MSVSTRAQNILIHTGITQNKDLKQNSVSPPNSRTSASHIHTGARHESHGEFSAPLISRRGLANISCSPGRWYVSDALKLALIHLMNEYDFKLEKEEAPRSFIWTTAILPRPSTMILMKARTKR